MVEKLSVKTLSAELESMRARLRGVELDFERKIEGVLEEATSKLRARVEGHLAQPSAGLHGGGISAEQRRRMIAETAYIIAERRGFDGGSPEQDWLEAERQVDETLLLEALEPPAEVTAGGEAGRSGAGAGTELTSSD